MGYGWVKWDYVWAMDGLNEIMGGLNEIMDEFNGWRKEWWMNGEMNRR